jgi:acetolactate synthase-1/2/3 large subunit
MRSELGALHAADGYARTSGEVTVAMTSTGPGAGNAVGPYTTIAKDGSRVVHLSTWDGADETLSLLHRVPEQSQWAQVMGQPMVDVVDQNSLQRLAHILRTGHGSVSVLMPTQSRQGPEADALATGGERAVPAFDHEVFEPWLNSARRCLWIGGGARAAGVSAIADLVAASDAAVVTTLQGKDLVNSSATGFVGCTVNSPLTLDAVGAADVCLAIGSRFTAFSTRGWHSKFPPTMISLNISHRAAWKGETTKVVDVQGDVADYLGHLIKALKERPTGGFGARTRTALVQRAAALEPRGEMVWIRAIQAALRPGDIVVGDTTKLAFWAINGLDVPAGVRFHFSGQLSMGFGLPAAFGSAVGAPDGHVIAIVGDGSFISGVGELSAVASHGAALSILLLDDSGYGILRRPAGPANQFCTFGGPVWASLIESFGMDFVDLGRPTPKTLLDTLSERPRRSRVIRLDASWLGHDWRSGHVLQTAELS